VNKIKRLSAQALIENAQAGGSGVVALGNAIVEHQALYDAGKAVISDADFDKMVAALAKADPASPVLKHLGKPATKQKIEHILAPMLSLSKCYDKTEIVDWCIEADTDAFQISPKYDGVSLSLIYEQGKLTEAATRGDGRVGDSVLHNVLKMPTVPRALPGGPTLCVIRGEAIFSRESWAKVRPHFEARAAKRTGTVNARNAAAGVLQSKNADSRILENLDFIAYDCLSDHTESWSLGEVMRRIFCFFSAGFVWTSTVPEVSRFLDLAIDHARNECSYETDGIVVKVSAYSDREKLGVTAHHPKWAIALKFQGDTGETTLRDVVWQVSRTGTITPVAVVDPVSLSGATITRATLHNLKQLESLQLCIKGRVEMTRRGGVIPHIERSLSPVTKGIQLPLFCPCCAAPTTRVRDFLYCSNAEECPDVQRQRLLFWAQQTDMIGWGEEVIATLYNDGDVLQPSELYRLNRSMMIEFFGKELGPKLMREAEAKRTMPRAAFLRALGIDGIGSTQSEKIVKHFEDVSDLIDWATESVGTPLNIAGIGSTLEENLRSGIAQYLGEIKSLLRTVTLITPKKQAVSTGPFAGKKIVFTGKLSDMEREQARDLVRSYGAETPAGVTRSTDMLVVGDGAKEEQKSKRDKAAAYNAKGANIQIVPEATFIEMVAEAMRGAS
jgi:DNA ligase (NAD+)